MAGDFRRVPLKQFPRAEFRKDTRESKYWKTFEFPVIVKEYSAINYVNFSPVAPYDCLVTSSAKVQIFAPYTNEVKRTSNRNKENVFGARYRLDGKLMVAGGDSGLVQVLDVKSRAILRNLKGHTKATHVCSFGKDFTKIFSASDDKTLRYWDIPFEKELSVIKAHEDYIRCGCINPMSTDMFVSGSYDHTVKIWDCRSSTVAMEMDHGAPVECVLMHQNGSICLSAGSNYITAWDTLAGGKLFHRFSNHQKTITSMCFDGEYKRLLTGSLDRHIKVYDVQDYSIVASIAYPSAILSMDLSADSNHLVAGISDGAISLRHRAKATADTDVQNKSKRKFRPGSYLFRMRNQSSKPVADDLVIDNNRKVSHKLGKVDQHLKKFRYREALDQVLCPRSAGNASYIISVICELSRRDGLEVALSNRDPDSLKEIMSFLVRNISHPLYAKTLVPVADLIIDMYSTLVGQNKTFDYMLRKLNGRIKRELRTQEEMMKLLGALEQFFSMASPAPSIDSISQNEVTTDSNKHELVNNDESDVEIIDVVEVVKKKIRLQSDGEVDFVVDLSDSTNVIVD